MSDEVLQAIRETIKETVNGKIDRIDQKLDEHNRKHEKDMQDLRPIIKEFKERQIRDAFLKESGEKLKWISSIMAALLVMWLFIKGFIPKL